MSSRVLKALGTTAALGGAAFVYGSVLERNWFALRRIEVPVLPDGAAQLRVLHISDAHLTPGRHRLMSWIRSLDALAPDLVVNTGDSIAHRDAVQPFLDSLGPLLDRPGIFVYGSNDLYSPLPKNPVRNVYFAMLERKVGLCNVVKTAMAMGVTRADGRSLLQWDGKNGPPADDLPSFTLGSVNVSPMSMAAAYATVAARGVYCKPVAVAKILSPTGAKLPVQSAGCHQAIPTGVADAASYVLQGVLQNGTAAGLGIGRPAAGKTGTSDNFDFAAFGGYTPDLAGYVSVFNPIDPVKFPMQGTGSCYRLGCSGQMFGADAPAHTWQMTFQHATLANPALGFVMADIPGELWSMGNGQTNPNQKKKGHGGKGGGGGGGGNSPGGGGTGGGPPTN